MKKYDRSGNHCDTFHEHTDDKEYSRPLTNEDFENWRSEISKEWVKPKPTWWEKQKEKFYKFHHFIIDALIDWWDRMVIK